MRMSHVKYFLALSLDRSFTLAAKRCGISQPSLTNAIRHFEQELGGELFHRGTTETTLSELGLAVRPTSSGWCNAKRTPAALRHYLNRFRQI